MPILEITGLVALAALAWLWFDSLKARDIGIHAVRTACKVEGLQLLDETVAIASLKPVRDDDGQLVLQRVYAFEYSDTGDNRRNGSVVLRGHAVTLLNVGLHAVASDVTLH